MVLGDGCPKVVRGLSKGGLGICAGVMPLETAPSIHTGQL
jgi:hypothetical protein